MGILGTPLQIKELVAKNRFLRSATMEYLADLEGKVTDDLLKLYYDVARGGSGLIVTGCAAVEQSGKGWAHQLGVWDDGQIEGLAKLARVMHTFGDGCLCAVQISRQGATGTGYSYGTFGHGFTLEELTDEQIEGIITAYGDAARRVREAGFDAVQVHGAHGYLVSQLFSPALNTRTDAWGGSLENRTRFPLAVQRAIRRGVGDDFVVMWKLNTSDYVEDGAGVDEYAQAAGMLVEAGVDLIEMSGGVKEQIALRARLRKEAGEREAYFAAALGAFRDAVGSAPLALTGGIRSPQVMEELLGRGVDLIGVCRPIICEPDFPRRLLSSPDKRTAKCTSCSQCLRRIATQGVKCVEFDQFQEVIRGV
jgi:2,4-dienoyl-CoA reductase-like NADH-dependent reductase (Old Yellow Enzyme family)